MSRNVIRRAGAAEQLDLFVTAPRSQRPERDSVLSANNRALDYSRFEGANLLSELSRLRGQTEVSGASIQLASLEAEIKRRFVGALAVAVGDHDIFASDRSTLKLDDAAYQDRRFVKGAEFEIVGPFIDKERLGRVHVILKVPNGLTISQDSFDTLCAQSIFSIASINKESNVVLEAQISDLNATSLQAVDAVRGTLRTERIMPTLQAPGDVVDARPRSWREKPHVIAGAAGNPNRWMENWDD